MSVITVEELRCYPTGVYSWVHELEDESGEEISFVSRAQHPQCFPFDHLESRGEGIVGGAGGLVCIMHMVQG